MSMLEMPGFGVLRGALLVSLSVSNLFQDSFAELLQRIAKGVRGHKNGSGHVSDVPYRFRLACRLQPITC